MHGTVKSFNTTYGYGFITVDSLADDVFVHVSAIASRSVRHLLVGQRVVFDLVMDLSSPRAANVKVAGDLGCRSVVRGPHLGAAISAERITGRRSGPSPGAHAQCVRESAAPATTRENRTAVRPGCSCTLTRLLDAPVATVWDVWTQAEHFARWFHASPSSVSLDVRPGGSWQATQITPDGTEYPVSGSYEKVITHQRLVTTLTLPNHPPAVSDISFTDLGDQTKVALTQTVVTDIDYVEANCARVLDGVSGYLAAV